MEVASKHINLTRFMAPDLGELILLQIFVNKIPT